MSAVPRATVIQINISRGGIPKVPVESAMCTVQGLVGDAWNHPRIHGGPKQALLLITSEGLAELAAAGFPVYPGALGENVTTAGLDRTALRIGQQYRIGEVVIELTKVRVPCATLDVHGPGVQKTMYDARVRAGDETSPRWGLSGFYAAVRVPGVIRTGDQIDLV